MQKIVKLFKEKIYHCYFQAQQEAGFTYFPVKGTPKDIRAILEVMFNEYEYPKGCWGRLMTIEDFEKDSKDNTKLLCNIQHNTDKLQDEHLN